MNIKVLLIVFLLPVLFIISSNALAAPEKPVADFHSPEIDEQGAISNEIAQNTVISFLDNSSGSPSSWFWDFGDGTTSTEQNPTHVYGARGGFTVNLTVSNAAGSSTISKYGYALIDLGNEFVSPAYFSSSATSGEAPFKVTFHEEASIYHFFNSWSFGDGSHQDFGLDDNYDIQTDVEHTYLEPGKYTVALYQSTGAGISAITKYRYITVTGYARPVASFNAETVPIRKSMKIAFTDKSIGNPASWFWNFGDGASSTEQNPTHSYSTVGNYTVNLTVSNAYGTNSSSATIAVSEYVAVLPVADFSTSMINELGPLSIQFTDRSLNATQWKWNFGDGSSSYEQNPQHTYSAAGSYEVNLKVNNENGTDSKLAVINVQLRNASLLPAGIYAYVTNSGDNSVSIIDTATNAVVDTVPGGPSPYGVAVTPDGEKVYIANQVSGKVAVIDTETNTIVATVPAGWFPHGVAVSPDGKKVYVTDCYTVSVIDTATNNEIASISAGSDPQGIAVSPDGKKIYVANYKSNDVFVIDTTTNFVISMVPVGSNPEGIAVTPDGKKVYVTNIGSNNISVIDSTTNNVTASVSVGEGPDGVAVSPDGKKVYVTNGGNYDVPGNTVSVIDTATNSVIDIVPVGEWPAGIAVSPDGKNVYVANKNSYNVSVIDTASNTVAASVYVGSYPVAFGNFIGTIPGFEPGIPVANFSYNLTGGSAPLSVQFTDLSVNATDWKWDFGDGENSTDRNPAHTYSTAGNYTVNLTVSNKKGTDSKFAMVTVSEKPFLVLPRADFKSNPVSGFAPLNVQFIDASQNATVWRWDFGDGATSSEQSPSHTFFSTGSYFVTQTVNNTNGTDSKCAMINVLGHSSSSGGSSSGGAGGSPEPQSNVEVKERSQAFVTSGHSAKFDFPNNATSVVYVSFVSKRTAGKTAITIEMLKNKSTLTSNAPTGEIYKYLNIWVGNSGFATPDNIENAVVCFRVEKSWIQDKKIDRASITLDRYSDRKWNKLSTSQSGEDDKYLYLTAQTVGFSPFAIMGEKSDSGIIQPSADKTQNSAFNGAQNNTNTENSVITEQSNGQTQNSITPGKISTKTPGFEIASGIICLLCVFLYKKSKKE